MSTQLETPPNGMASDARTGETDLDEIRDEIRARAREFATRRRRSRCSP